jgi:hypothetical protein
MNEFDLILEECIDLIASGDSSLEECLSNYPEYAAQLEPILITVSGLQEEGRNVVPPPDLRIRIRGELNNMMKSKPQKKSRFPVFFGCMAQIVSVLTMALVMTSTMFVPGISARRETLQPEAGERKSLAGGDHGPARDGSEAFRPPHQ